MACKRATRRKSSNWCFLVILVLHLRGVGSSRSRVMTGRASRRDHGWPSGGGRSSRSQRSDETTRRCAGSGRVGESRIAGPSASDVVEERSPERGMLRVKQKGKERIGLGENGTNETAKRRPQSEAEETTRGWTGGLEGLWGGALQGCERDAQEGRRARNSGGSQRGRLHQPGHPDAERLVGSWGYGGSARAKVPQGFNMAAGRLPA
jgi:hypothetical protein